MAELEIDMAFPPSVETVDVTWGKATSFLGEEISSELTLTPLLVGTKRIVWQTSGEPMLPMIETKTAGPGESGTMSLPVVDQAGWVDDSGAAYSMWAYEAKVRTQIGSSSIEVVTIVAPMLGDEPIDLDLVPINLTPGSPVVVPVAPTLTIGNVISAATASALIRGTNPDFILDLALPKAADGLNGDKGDTGDTSPSSSGSWAAGTRTVVGTGPSSIRATLTGNVVLSITGTPVANKAYTVSLTLKQDATGGRTITWPTGVVWPEGLKPALPTAPNAIALYHLYWDGERWIGLVGGSSLA